MPPLLLGVTNCSVARPIATVAITNRSGPSPAGMNTPPPKYIIDSFQADRSPDGNYKTMNLAAPFVRERGLFTKPENKGLLSR